MIRFRLAAFVYFFISAFLVSAQDFNVDQAITNYESLASTGSFLSASRLSYKIGEHYLDSKAYAKAITFFDNSFMNAGKASNIEQQAEAVFKKGVAEKQFAESGVLSMTDEQSKYQESVASFKSASELYAKSKNTNSRGYLYSLFYGGEVLHIMGSFRESNGPLRTVLKYAQKNKIESLILQSSNLIARNYEQLDDDTNFEYYQSIFDSYNELKVSKDSLRRAQVHLKISKDSLTQSRLKLMASIDSLKRTQRFLKVTSESLSKSKDSLMRSKESLEEYEASLQKAQDSLLNSKKSLEESIVNIALLDSANLEQRSALEIRQAEIIKQQNEIIKQQEKIREKEKEVTVERDRYAQLNSALTENRELLNIMIGALALIGILLVSALFAYQYKRRTTKKLEQKNKQINDQKSLLEARQNELKEEKSKTEALLLNILPAPVADELRKNKRVIPRYYKMVTIMFTDFSGFTTIAEKMSPGEIVRELDACFVAFDQIIERYEKAVGRKCIEKIKTIGDGYMCAGGVPHENETNPMDVVRVALAMNDFMQKRKQEKIAKNEPYFELRIGINTGPVVAGVVGKKKFAYDIWGDAVNLASRMESSSKTGRVNISGETYKYLKDKFFFTHRGKINAKNKGEVDMYFVDGRVKYVKDDKRQQA
jgi:class 3 adenylate cyclase